MADPDVFAPSPWVSYTYDANDNAGRTHGAAAEAYRDHWNTPTSVEVDALGRAVVAVARSGPDPDRDWFTTRTRYDIQGNLVALTDALGRDAFSYRYDLAGRRWRVDSIDAGRRDTILDCARRHGGEPRQQGRAHARRLRRRCTGRSEDGPATAPTGPVTLRQRVEYGDGGDPDQPAAERDRARAHNLLGATVAHYDEAGVATLADIDFKGNAARSQPAG